MKIWRSGELPLRPYDSAADEGRHQVCRHRRIRKETQMSLGMTRLLTFAVAIVFALPSGAIAQSPAPAAAPPQAEQLLKAEELDALVAPIALYPDTLLSLVLMASTYPLEVVQAERWASTNKNLKGDALKAEADKQSWDDSLKAL